MRPETGALIKRCRACLTAVGWQHPFFFVPAQKIWIRSDDSIPTACIDQRGIVYVNHAYAYSLCTGELAFVLIHELLHQLMLHLERRGTRNLRRWNRAADRVINRALSSFPSDILRLPSDALLPIRPEYDSYTVEEAYEVEPEMPGDEIVYCILSPGTGCGPVLSRGGNTDLDVPGEGEAPGEAANKEFPRAEDCTRIWQQIAATAEAASARAGRDRGDQLVQLVQRPPSRVPWSQKLRGTCARAEAVHGRDDVSWSRRNRRSHDSEFILPGGVSYRATVACAIDTSGSMTDASLTQAVSEILAVSRAANVRIYLVVHDSVVQWAGWLDVGVQRYHVEKRMIGRGGTRFAPAYEAIEKAGRRFDYMIHLTDGMPYDRWPDRPDNVRRLIVALLGCASRVAVPEGSAVVEVEV